jgi:hypothetical protein
VVPANRRVHRGTVHRGEVAQVAEHSRRRALRAEVALALHHGRGKPARQREPAAEPLALRRQRLQVAHSDVVAHADRDHVGVLVRRSDELGQVGDLAGFVNLRAGRRQVAHHRGAARLAQVAHRRRPHVLGEVERHARPPSVQHEHALPRRGSGGARGLSTR